MWPTLCKKNIFIHVLKHKEREKTYLCKGEDKVHCQRRGREGHSTLRRWWYKRRSVSSLHSLSPPIASLTLLILILLLYVSLTTTNNVGVFEQIKETSLNLMSDALEWPTTMSSSLSLYKDDDETKKEMESGFSRRSLFWRRMGKGQMVCLGIENHKEDTKNSPRLLL
ncbi:hypothetical protein RJT34_07863 [Clitoria ternatea]|uniref:Transmembrane protein n=1 Tax=Clitoria ternatea TaxID=43366 RepID=A0AAN9PTR9_CLITE